MEELVRSNEARISEETDKATFVQIINCRYTTVENVHQDNFSGKFFYSIYLLNLSTISDTVTRRTLISNVCEQNSKMALDREIKAKKEEMSRVSEKLLENERKISQSQRSIDGLFSRVSLSFT